VPSEEEDLPTAGMIQQFYDCLIQSIDAVKAWANRVPGFSELCKHDQDQLFQSAALELVMLRIAYNCRCVVDRRNYLRAKEVLFLRSSVFLLAR